MAETDNAAANNVIGTAVDALEKQFGYELVGDIEWVKARRCWVAEVTNRRGQKFEITVQER